MPISLNPGFALLAAALIALIAPAGLRAALAVAASIAAGALALTPDFGAHDVFRQVGLTVVPLRLDAAAQVFGIAIAGAGVVLGLATSHRRDAFEDAALLAHLGGAMTAIYGGDLVTFVVGAEVSILAGAALVLCGRTPGARAAAGRFVTWHALAGALFVVGVGLVWAQTNDVKFDRIDARTPGGLCLLLAMLIRAGGPLAHVWIKDAAPRAGVIGFAALGPITTTLALYALIRMFVGEPALATIGAVAAVWGVVFAAAASQPRVMLSYGLIAQTGLLVMALGVGAPLVLAGVSAAAFTGLFTAVLGGLLVGWATRPGADDPAAPPVWGAAPATTALAVLAAAAAVAAPGLATFASASLLQDAFARQASDWMLVVFVLASAGVAAAAGVRAPLTAYFGARRVRGAAPSFAFVLACAIAAFVLISVGAAPDWLFALVPPSPIMFAPYDWDHVATRLQLAAGALVVLALASVLAQRAARRAAGAQGGGLRDVDWLYRTIGPRLMAAAAAAVAAAFTAWVVMMTAVSAAAGRLAAVAAARLDRPAAPGGRRAGVLVAFGACGLMLLCAMTMS
ncbi:MAG: hypothetical protein KJS97_08565 [Alphaproteobacteria bacterium]|nr:hypothetical protein [Alphaproteobacteria bacterium]